MLTRIPGCLSPQKEEAKREGREKKGREEKKKKGGKEKSKRKYSINYIKLPRVLQKT